MRLNFKKYGSGRPVIVLHGLFGMLDNWQSIAKRLSEHYEMILVDLPNHGRSPHTDIFSYPAMADALQEFIVQEGIEMPHLIGHSMGAKVAMQLAIQYPDIAESLIIVDMGTRKYSPHHNVILAALADLDISLIQKRSDADEALGSRITDPGVRLFLMKNLTRQKEGGYTWKMNLPVILDQYDNILEGVHSAELIMAPTLFVRGDKSGYIKDEDWEQINRQFADAGLKTIKDSGHWVHADQPDQLYQELLSWLDSH